MFIEKRDIDLHRNMNMLRTIIDLDINMKMSRSSIESQIDLKQKHVRIDMKKKHHSMIRRYDHAFLL
jgi:hypothetical protein